MAEHMNQINAEEEATFAQSALETMSSEWIKRYVTGLHIETIQAALNEYIQRRKGVSVVVTLDEQGSVEVASMSYTIYRLIDMGDDDPTETKDIEADAIHNVESYTELQLQDVAILFPEVTSDGE